MYKGSKILAIIPARGGSKRLPRKNILPFLGKPLIAWTIEETKQSRYIDRLILSSENEEIMAIATEYGCDVPFSRPAMLSRNDTPGIDPVLHAIETLYEKYDYVVLLQPTSPLRRASDIDNCIEQCIIQKKVSCVSVTEVEKSPYWMYLLDEGGMMQPLLDIEKPPVKRQDLPEVYILNGAVYVAQIPWLMKSKTFVTKETFAYIMPKERSIDIDQKFDFKLAEFLMQNRLEKRYKR